MILSRGKTTEIGRRNRHGIWISRKLVIYSENLQQNIRKKWHMLLTCKNLINCLKDTCDCIRECGQIWTVRYCSCQGYTDWFRAWKPMMKRARKISEIQNFKQLFIEPLIKRFWIPLFVTEDKWQETCSINYTRETSISGTEKDDIHKRWWW